MVKRAKTPLIVFGLLFCVLTGLVTWWSTGSKGNYRVVWEGPELSVSERDCFINGLMDLHQHWVRRDDGIALAPSASWQKPQSITQVLAVDLPQGQLWLERQGTPVPGLRVSLPTQFTWTLHHALDGEIQNLPPFTGWQDVGQYRHLDGIVFLVGQEGTGSHIVWCLWGNADSTVEMIAEEGVFDPNLVLAQRGSRNRRSPRDDHMFPLIRDAALLQHLRENRSQDSSVYGEALGDARLAQRMRWRLLQGPLHRKVEEQLRNQGLAPLRIVTLPGPDFAAGRVGVHVQRDSSDSILKRIFGALGSRRGVNSGPGHVGLTVEDIGNHRWHCKHKVVPTDHAGTPITLSVDFNIQLPIQPSGHDTSGREASKQALAHETPSVGTPAWTLPLEAGVKLEVVGLCRYPGSTWWAPDGSALDYWPGFLNDSLGLSNEMHSALHPSGWPNAHIARWPGRRQGDKRCIMVMRVPSAVGFRSGAGASSAKDAKIFFGKPPMVDRYGHDQGFCPEQYMVLKLNNSTEQGTGNFEIGIHVLEDPEVRPKVHDLARDASMTGDSSIGGESHDRVSVSALPFTWVRFEALALHPGQQTDFRWSVTDKPEDPNSHYRFELRP